MPLHRYHSRLNKLRRLPSPAKLRSGSLLAALRNPVATVAALATLGSVIACTPSYSGNRHLGVLPPQPPAALWLGAFRAAPVDSALRGAAAVTASSTPHWSHVLLSLSGARPATAYTWRLHSGRCTDAGPAIGPDSRYEPLVPFADGTAKVDTFVPGLLDPHETYSVTVSRQSAATSSTDGCADLVYGTM